MMMRGLGRPFAAALVVVLVALTVASPLLAGRAEAHAALASQTPGNNEQLTRPPARVILKFSEAIERRLTSIKVYQQDLKTRVDQNDLAFDDNDPTFASVGLKDLQPGLYYVKWSNVSAVDGHPLDGQYPFIVLEPDGTFPPGVTANNASSTSGGALLPKNIDSALKWLALLSLATVGGAAFFLLVGMKPAASFLEDDDYTDTIDTVERWVIGLAHVLLPAAFIASAVLLLLTVHRFPTGISLWSYVTTVRVGQYHLARLILIVVALASADLLFLGNSRRLRNAGLIGTIAAIVAALFTFSVVSHSAADKGKFWAVGSDFVHVLASAGWLGALAMIFVFVRWRGRKLQDDARWLYVANVFDRFSLLAGVCVAAILATGTFNGLAAVPTAGAMIHTTYGKVLLAKIALVLPLLGVAGINAFFLKPRLVQAIDVLYQDGGSSSSAARERQAPLVERVRRVLVPTIALELTLIVAVFAAVGVLTQTATASGEIAEQNAKNAAPVKFEQSGATGGIKFDLIVEPNQADTVNNYTLNITNPDGSPNTTVSLARLRFSYQDVANAVAPSQIDLDKGPPGLYRGAGVYFTTQGNWRIDMTIRRTDADDVAHAFILPVAPKAASTATGGGSIFALPFTVFNWNEVLGAILALGGGLVLIYRRQIGFGNVAYRATVTGATGIVLAGAVLAFGVHQHSTVANPTAGNKVPSTAQSVAAGKALFQTNCVVCHGIDGRGDGPQAPQLSPAPTDFRLHMPLHTDPQFYAFIHDGYGGTAMPAFGSAFSETDIWNLVNYLRSAFTAPPSQ